MKIIKTKDYIMEKPVVVVVGAKKVSAAELALRATKVIKDQDKELSTEKTLSNSANSTVKDNVPDVVLMGVKSNNWRLMCKAFSKNEGWMKSTKGLNLSTNQVLVQTTTQQKNSDGSYSIADTLICVNGNLIESDEEGIFIITI
jgi:hypothetical protein